MSAAHGDIRYEVFIDAVPEKVFGFFTDPALMAQWFGQSHVLDPRVGGLFHVEVSDGNVALGVYTEVNPPHRVVFTFGWEAHDAQRAMLVHLPPGASRVEIDLLPKDGGTLVRFRHTGLPEITSEVHRQRWSMHFARLQSATRHMDEQAGSRQPDADEGNLR